MKVRAKPQPVHLSRTPQPELELAKRLQRRFHFSILNFLSTAKGKFWRYKAYQRNICLVTFPGQSLRTHTGTKTCGFSEMQQTIY
jgi:hypothetical protein